MLNSPWSKKAALTGGAPSGYDYQSDPDYGNYRWNQLMYQKESGYGSADKDYSSWLDGEINKYGQYADGGGKKNTNPYGDVSSGGLASPSGYGGASTPWEVNNTGTLLSRGIETPIGLAGPSGIPPTDGRK
jgi:hypothetical protein